MMNEERPGTEDEARADPPPVQRPLGYHVPVAPPTAPGVLGAYAFESDSKFRFDTTTSDERTMAMLCHLLSIFTGFLGPLIVWLIKRKESRFVDAHGRAVLNFHFTYLIGSVAIAVVAIVAVISMVGILLLCLIYPLFFAYAIFVLVMNIIHCVEASKGEYKPYPLSIPFFAPVK